MRFLGAEAPHFTVIEALAAHASAPGKVYIVLEIPFAVRTQVRPLLGAVDLGHRVLPLPEGMVQIQLPHLYIQDAEFREALVTHLAMQKLAIVSLLQEML